MAIKLMYITNEPRTARIVEQSGVDRIFVDLETRGKEERQGHIDSVKSHHALSDISQIKDILTQSELLVRANALYEGSRDEVNEIISRGADIVMLPMWTTADDARRFRDLVNGRAKVLLLLETIGAEHSIDELLGEEGIDEVHIGLNDLHLQYHLQFMFELLSNGKVEAIMNKLTAAGMFSGFGGVASLDGGLLSGRNILTEHYRLGSQMAILSRSFCDTSKTTDYDEIQAIFAKGVKDIRDFETFLQQQPADYYLKNKQEVAAKVSDIVSRIQAKGN